MAFDLGESFRNSWLGAIANPVGYSIKHENMSDAVAKYKSANPPAAAFNLEGLSEQVVVVGRQQWIDGCVGKLKATDVGYSKANLQNNCGSAFDKDPAMIQLMQEMQVRIQADEDAVKAKVQENIRNIMAIAAIGLLITISLYLYK